MHSVERTGIGRGYWHRKADYGMKVWMNEWMLGFIRIRTAKGLVTEHPIKVWPSPLRRVIVDMTANRTIRVIVDMTANRTITSLWELNPIPGLNSQYTVRDFKLTPRCSVRSLLFWDATHRKLVVSYRRFGTTYRFHLQVSSNTRRMAWNVWPLEMGRAGCPETSVATYATLCKISEERRSQLLYCPS